MVCYRVAGIECDRAIEFGVRTARVVIDGIAQHREGCVRRRRVAVQRKGGTDLRPRPRVEVRRFDVIARIVGAHQVGVGFTGVPERVARIAGHDGGEQPRAVRESRSRAQVPVVPAQAVELCLVCAQCRRRVLHRTPCGHGGDERQRQQECGGQPAARIIPARKWLRDDRLTNGDRRRQRLRHELDGSDEPVASPRDGRDRGAQAVFAQHLAQRVHALCDVALADVFSDPDAVEQLVLRHHGACALDQCREGIDDARPKRERVAGQAEHVTRRIELERADRVPFDDFLM